ncbi:membrane protein [Actinocatenispora thailandica]|uniref:Membrane protein n=1 Tax=Actinocatenispora thailandica TaxID=227318 RepID=A0A7R7DRB1_9ACTN|nr:FtsX-like permease family protein [Actinocatenispora thailandica]BCJ36092.1 membrane protein [Actinocatenispora thailandica]
MFLTYLRRELRRRRRQAIVVALGLALGIGLTVTVTALSAGVQAAQQSVLHSLYGVGTDISVTQQATRGSGGPQRFDVQRQRGSDQSRKSFSTDRVTAGIGLQSFDAATVAKVARQPHVSAAAGGLSLTDVKVDGKFAQQQSGGQGTGRGGPGGFARGGSGGASGAAPSQPPINVDTYSIAGVDLSAPGVGPLSSVRVTAGRSFASSDAKGKVAVLASGFAKQRGLAKGKTLTVAGTKFTVVGVVSGADQGSDVYLPLAAAQGLANLPGKVTTIYVKATSASAVDAAGGEVRKVLPKATVTSSSDLAGEVSGSLSGAASLAGNLGRWLAVVVLIAAFVTAALFTVSAVSRRIREFGTLKALGWRTRRIVGQVLGEALVQGVLGGVLGVALGFLGTYLVNRLAPALTATMPSGPAGGAGAGPGGGRFGGGFARAAQHTVEVHLAASVTIGTVVLAVALAVAGGLIAGGFGGWRAARLRPADALRRVD